MKIAQFIVAGAGGGAGASGGYDLVQPDPAVQAWEQRVPFDTPTVSSPIATLEHPGMPGNGAVVRVHEDGFYVVNAIIWLKLGHTGGAG